MDIWCFLDQYSGLYSAFHRHTIQSLDFGNPQLDGFEMEEPQPKLINLSWQESTGILDIIEPCCC